MIKTADVADSADTMGKRAQGGGGGRERGGCGRPTDQYWPILPILCQYRFGIDCETAGATEGSAFRIVGSCGRGNFPGGSGSLWKSGEHVVGTVPRAVDVRPSPGGEADGIRDDACYICDYFGHARSCKHPEGVLLELGFAVIIKPRLDCVPQIISYERGKGVVAVGRSAKFVTVVFSWLLLLFMIAAGLWMVKLGWYAIELQNRILVDFRPVPGRVITSRVVRAKDARDYSPWIVYTYQVNNRHFRSHATTIIDQQGSLEWAERIVARFPAGQPCRVFVSPVDPRRSVLIRRSGLMPFLAVLIGIVLLWAAGPTFKALQRAISEQPRAQRSRGTALSRRLSLIGHLLLGTAPVTGVCWSYFLIYPPPHLWWMGALGISSAFISVCIAVLALWPELAWWPKLAGRIAHSASSVGYLFCTIAPLTYLLTGFAAVLEQHKAINDYVPMRGAVISSGVAGDRGGFTPAISYSYHFRKVS